MKAFYTSFNKKNNGAISDGYCFHNIIEKGGLSNFMSFDLNIKNCDIVIYIRNFEREFEFDIDTAKYILDRGLKIIVFDYMEYGSPALGRDDYLHIYDILGYKIDGQFLKQLKNDYGQEATSLMAFFNAANENNQIFCYFKRELSRHIKLEANFPIYPIDYMNVCVEDFEIDSKETYDSRPINCFYTWGLSNINRQILHGRLITEPNKFGHDFILSEPQLEKYIEEGRKNGMVVMKTDWYERIPYSKYVPISKSGIDLYGAGMKCFRNIESCINGLSFKQDPSDLLHAYPWVHDFNCIYLPNKNKELDIDAAIDIIHYRLKVNQGDLYTIYVESCKNALKYKNKSYFLDYIYPRIKDLLNIYRYE